MRNISVLILLALYGLNACNNSSFSANSTAVETKVNAVDFADAGTEQHAAPDLLDSSLPIVRDSVIISSGIDLIIALDASGSMGEERAAVENNLNQLMLALLKGNLDPRIHLMVGQNQGQKGRAFKFPAEIDGSRIAVVNQSIGSNNALSHVSKLLSGMYASRYLDIKGAIMNSPFALRPGAQLEVLVISDDDGFNAQGSGNTPLYSNLAKDFDPTNEWKATVSGIIGLQSSVQVEGVCEVARVGLEYITLANRTGGSLLDICSKDWSVLLQRFSVDLVKRSSSVLLSKKPLDSARIVVKLDGSVLGLESWTLHAVENRLYLNSAVPFKAGMVLEVSYNSAP